MNNRKKSLLNLFVYPTCTSESGGPQEALIKFYLCAKTDYILYTSVVFLTRTTVSQGNRSNPLKENGLHNTFQPLWLESASKKIALAAIENPALQILIFSVLVFIVTSKRWFLVNLQII